MERSVAELLALGASAYPIYQAILSDPDSTINEILGMYELLVFDHLGEDRRQFAPFVALRLAAPNVLISDREAQGGGARQTARRYLIYALANIGDENHAWVLMPFLNNEDQMAQFRVVKAISAIGGQRERDELTAWLAFQNPNLRVVAEMWKLRDEMDKRLLAKQPK